MMFSIIIPVFNRPNELNELLESLSKQDFTESFEVVIVEDGSIETSEEVLISFKDELFINYYYKKNTGPGDSRNFGMQRAKGDYFILFDSDCIIPPNYLKTVKKSLDDSFVDCFGGPDDASSSFTDLQKAINFSMTSLITTGGIRGASEKINTFQPRSFNMGLSKKAFEASNGFTNIHPGEDPDLTLRLWKLGFKTKLIKDAFVYHKRRIDIEKFYIQVNKFGKARPILNHWHPEYNKISYFFPSIFITCFFSSLLLCFFGWNNGILLFFIYYLIHFLLALFKTKKIKVALLSCITTTIQFYGYGVGFIESYIAIEILREKPSKRFPELFFNKKND